MESDLQSTVQWSVKYLKLLRSGSTNPDLLPLYPNQPHRQPSTLLTEIPFGQGLIRVLCHGIQWSLVSFQWFPVRQWIKIFGTSLKIFSTLFLEFHQKMEITYFFPENIFSQKTFYVEIKVA